MTTSILKVFCYFDIFNHPIDLTELRKFLPVTLDASGDLDNGLKALLNEQIIFQFGPFYSLQDKKQLLDERLASEARAKEYLEKARKNAQLIATFPYVQAVFVSGSLSKGVIREGGDIDYFIITSPNRLWICRSLLILYKKIFRLNSHKYFCLNYFIDANHLEIEDKNIFTATETASLIPMMGTGVVPAFFDANTWVRQYLPNISFPVFEPPKSAKMNFLRKLIEACLGNKFGDYLDKKSLEFTLAYWSNKFQNFDKQAFKLAFKSRSYISKHHPGNFQEKVLSQFSIKQARLSEQFKQTSHATE